MLWRDSGGVARAARHPRLFTENPAGVHPRRNCWQLERFSRRVAAADRDRPRAGNGASGAVPQGRPKIAQHFGAGLAMSKPESPGRDDRGGTARGFFRPCRDWVRPGRGPSTEVLGYFLSPAGLGRGTGARSHPWVFNFQRHGVATACRLPACGDEPSPTPGTAERRFWSAVTCPALYTDRRTFTLIVARSDGAREAIQRGRAGTASSSPVFGLDRHPRLSALRPISAVF